MKNADKKCGLKAKPNDDDDQPKSDSDENEEQKRLIELENQLSDLELDNRHQESLELKSKGNQEYQKDNHEEALLLYLRALDLLPLRYTRERAVLLNNCCAARCKSLDVDSFKSTNSHPCLKDLNKAIKLAPAYASPLYKRAAIYRSLGQERLDESLADYNKILELHGEISESLRLEVSGITRQLEREIEERNERLKKEMMGKLKDLGNLCLRPFGLSTENFSLENNESGGYSVKFNP